MYLLISTKILNIEGLHLFLTGIGIITPLAIMLIMFERSRRKDLKKNLDLKANIDYVDEQTLILEKQDTKLRKEIKTTMESHEKVHEADRNLLKQIQSDLTLIKDHLINRKK